MLNYSVSFFVNNGKDKQELPQKAYAHLQLSEILSLDDFARHIADHGCVYGRGDISNVLTLAVDCLRELMLQGVKVSLGDLGQFYPSVSSVGAETIAEFTADNIKKVKVKPALSCWKLRQHWKP